MSTDPAHPNAEPTIESVQWGTNCLVCPHCKHERTDDLYDYMHDGRMFTTECERCEKEFSFEASVSWEYRSTAKVAE
jgi:hypothetical protein